MDDYLALAQGLKNSNEPSVKKLAEAYIELYDTYIELYDMDHGADTLNDTQIKAITNRFFKRQED